MAPGRVRNVEPAGAVLSFRYPDEHFTADTRTSFCRHVHFFASAQAVDAWTARDEGTFAMSIADGFEIGRRVNDATYGRMLSARAQAPRGAA